MVYEDQQKYAKGGTDGTGSCATGDGRILSRQEPTQVYPAAIADVPDRQRTTRSRLSRHSRDAKRMVRPASNHRLKKHPAFYNTLCCQQKTVAKTCCGSFVAFDSAAMSRHRVTKSQIKTGSYRFDRLGNTPCVSILHETLQTPSGSLQTAISKAFGYLRYFQSSVTWNGYRPRPKTRLCRRRIDPIERTFTAKIRNNFSRCWLRVRAFSQTLSRTIEHRKYHPNYATRSTTTRWQNQSSYRTLSKTYAKEFSKEHLWPTLADRNGFQYAQAQPWQCPLCAKSSQPDQRDSSAHPYPQPDDFQAHNLCSIQSKPVS